jgi:signal transduction histidine kinase
MNSYSDPTSWAKPGCQTCPPADVVRCLTKILAVHPGCYTKTESLHKILYLVKDLFRCESAQFVIRIENTADGYRICKYFEGAGSPTETLLQGGINHWCITHRSYYLTEEVDHANRIANGLTGPADLSTAPIRTSLNYVLLAPNIDEESVLFFPLIVRGECVGTLKLCDFSAARVFSTSHLTIANAVAEAVGNVLQLHQNIRDLEHQNDRFDTLLAEATDALDKLKIGERLTYQYLTATSHLHEIAGVLGGMASDREQLIAEIQSMSISYEQKSKFESIINRYAEHRKKAHRKVRELLSGKPPDETMFIKPHNVKDLINEQLDVYEKELEELNIRRKKSLSKAGIKVPLDESAFKYVVRILINNAIYALKTGPNRPMFLQIHATRGARNLSLRFVDNGRGIPREHQRKIFDAFFTTKAEGSGIGLYWARRTIDDGHGGHLSLEKSYPGEGSTFLLRLPLEGKTDAKSG